MFQMGNDRKIPPDLRKIFFYNPNAMLTVFTVLCNCIQSFLKTLVKPTGMPSIIAPQALMTEIA
jgi:urea transporter